MHNWKTRTAESMTTFWTYSDCLPGFESRSAKICLAYPPARPPPFMTLSDGTRAWTKEKRDRGEYITKTSRIPQLLQKCRLSRHMSLEMWKDILSEYQLEEYRVPWGNTLAAIAWNLYLLHQADRTRVGEVEGLKSMDHREGSLKRKRAVSAY